MDEVFENPVLGRREVEKPSPTANRLLHRIQFQIRNHQHRGRDTLGASYEGFDPSQKFSQIKRLAEIVVGSGIEQAHHRLSALLCRENEDWSMKFSATQVLENTLAALAGKHQVKHDCVINILLAKMRTGFSVGSMIHCQPGFAQCGHNILRQPLLVFDQEYSHEVTACEFCLKVCLSQADFICSDSLSSLHHQLDGGDSDPR